MMHPLYWLHAPSEHPSPPDHWSYSTLRTWRECPRRWWLERCRYPNVPGRFYPAPVTPAGLEGQLVHEVVEGWGKALRRGEEPGSLRLRCKVALREALTALKDNPRVDAGRVAAAVSLDTCVAKAHDFTHDLEPRGPIPVVPRDGSGAGTHRAPSGAEEYWITVDDPPLKGQLDRVRGGVVADYKTGAPDSAHEDQLLFYAVLWWLNFAEPPLRLELRYPGTVTAVQVPAPAELDAAASALRVELREAQGLLQRGDPRARPSADTCRYCPVRQLCDDYWVSPATAELRSPGTAAPPDGQGSSAFGDVRLTQLPADRRPDGAIVGQAVADGLGPVRIRLGAHLCPASSESVTVAKVLGARFVTEGSERMVTTTGGTEIFWEP